MAENTSSHRPPDAREQTMLDSVLRAVRRLRHGYVQVVVQDGHVIQIDTLEKTRLDRG